MRKRRIIAIALLLLLALGGVALWWAQSPAGLELMVRVVAGRLQQAYGLKLEVGHVEAALVDNQVVITDLRLEGKNGEELFTVKRVLAQLTPMQLLTGRLRLDRLELDAPRSRMAIVGGRVAGLPAFDTTGARLFKLNVTELLVRRGAVDVALEERGLLSVRDIDVHLEGARADRHDISFSVGGGSLDYGERRFRLSAFSGQGRQHGDNLLQIGRVDLDRISVDVEGLRAELSGAIDFTDRVGEQLPAAELELHFDVPLTEVKRLFDLAMSLDGFVAIDSKFHAAVGGEDVRAEGQLSATSLLVDDFNLGDTNVLFTATPERVLVDAFAMAWAGTVVTGSGEVALDRELSARVEASGRDFCFGEVLADMGLVGSWVNFYIDGHAEASGHLLPEFRLEGRGAGTVTGFVVNDRPYLEAGPEDAVLAIPQVEVSTLIAFDADKFEFPQATARDGLSTVHANATLNFDVERGMRIEVTDADADLETISPIAAVDLAGKGKVRGLIEGPYPDPTIKGAADIEDFILERYAFGHAMGDIEYHDLVLSFLRMEAHKGQSDYRADVVLDFNRGVDLSVEAALNETRAEDLRAIIPSEDVGRVMAFLRWIPLDGTLSGAGVARGDIKGGSTADLTGSADLTLGAGALFDQSFERGLARGRLSLKTLFMDLVELHKGDGVAQAAGTVQREDGALDTTLAVNGLPLERLEALENEPAPIDGVADLTATIGGTIEHPLGQGQLRVRAMHAGEVAIGAGQLALNLDGRELQLAGPGFDGRGLLAMHLTIESPFPYHATLELAQGSLATLLRPGRFPAALDARAAGSVTARGTLRELSNSRGTMRLDGLEVVFRGVEFTSPAPVAATWAGAEVDVKELALVHAAGDRISMRGRVGRRALSVEVESELGLHLVPAFTRHVSEASGELRLDLGISGPYQDPVLLGQGTLAGGRLDFPGFEHPIERLEAHFTMTRNAFIMDTAHASIDGAPVEGEGTMTFDGLVPEHLQLSTRILSPITLHVPESVTSRAQGALELAGRFDDLYLRGDVEVVSALYSENLDLERIPLEFQRRRLAPHGFDPADEQVHLDVRLHADDNLIVRNNLLDAELKGDVRLTGTDERPGMRGTLSALRGAAQFRGNRYDIDYATIDLVDPYKLSPVFDALAHTRTHGNREYDVDVYLQGPLEDLRIRLQSRPELAESDILLLVTLGFTREDVRDVGGMGGVGGTAALEALSTYSGLDREVKRVLPLPVHEVRLSSLFSESRGTTVPSVVVGIELLEGLQLDVPYVEGAHLRLQSSLLGTTDGRADQRVELDVRLNDRASLRFDLDNDAERNIGVDPGLDLNYRLEF